MTPTRKNRARSTSSDNTQPFRAIGSKLRAVAISENHSLWTTTLLESTEQLRSVPFDGKDEDLGLRVQYGWER